MSANTPPVKQVQPGQYLFRENEPSDSLYLIRKGSVSIRKRKGSAFIELAKVHSNEIIGELSYFDRKPRSAAAMALTEVEALQIPFESIDKIYASVPPYMKTIVAAMAERLRRADDVIRRLEKELISETGDDATPSDEPSIADVLSATSSLDSDEPIGARKVEDDESDEGA